MLEQCKTTRATCMLEQCKRTRATWNVRTVKDN